MLITRNSNLMIPFLSYIQLQNGVIEYDNKEFDLLMGLLPEQDNLYDDIYFTFFNDLHFWNTFDF